MTNEQRTKLLRACRGSWFMACNDEKSEVTTIRQGGITFRFSHCLKHDTGTGQLVEMTPYPNYDIEIPQSITEVDELLIRLIKQYRDEINDTLSDLTEVIDEVSEEVTDG